MSQTLDLLWFVPVWNVFDVLLYTRAYGNSWPTRLARMREMCGLEHYNLFPLAIGRFEPNLNLLLYKRWAKLWLEIRPVGRFRLDHTLSKWHDVDFQVFHLLFGVSCQYTDVVEIPHFPYDLPSSLPCYPFKQFHVFLSTTTKPYEAVTQDYTLNSQHWQRFQFFDQYMNLHYTCIEGRWKVSHTHPCVASCRAFTLVLGTVPAGTCSRNMFSVHTISSSMNDVLKRIVPARTVPAGTWSNHVLGTKTPR